MSDNLKEQIYNNLVLKETEDLLEIWQEGDTSEWTEQALEIIKEILLEWLGYVPPQSSEAQARQILSAAERCLERYAGARAGA